MHAADLTKPSMQRLPALLREPGGALLLGRGTWLDDAPGLALHSPQQVLVAHDPAEVPGLLAEVEAETGRGNLVVACLSYEAGACYGLSTHAPSPLVPLGWAAVYSPAQAARVSLSDLPRAADPPDLTGLQPRLNVTREQYGAAIAAIKEYIAAGDTYQVNCTCHARFRLEADPLEYFLALVASHPVPYAAYLNLGEAQVVSLSPELFLRRRAETLESRPMKGTRPRGRSAEEDAALAEELVASEKDRAENLMIVDMVRNDLGRVAQVGSVRAPRLFTAERYRSVWQMTGTVACTQRPGASLPEVFAATFPGASITGAPKRRTMEIIRELEPEPRGVYCGAVGLFLPGGDFTCGLPIRTLIHRNGQYDLGIGAGIVWDSQPQSEYEETLLKAQFAFRLNPAFTLFETLLLTPQGSYAFAQEHLARMSRSADYWGLPFDRSRAEELLAQAAREVGQSAGQAAVIRLELGPEGDLSTHARPAPTPPPEPVTALLSPHRTDPEDRLLYHKTSHRQAYDRERERAAEQGHFDVLFENLQGRLTEGAITNLFVRRDGSWLTPPVSDGLLPGVWRASFLREVGGLERSLTVADLAGAQEVVLGNSVRGAVQVAAVFSVGGERVF